MSYLNCQFTRKNIFDMGVHAHLRSGTFRSYRPLFLAKQPRDEVQHVQYACRAGSPGAHDEDGRGAVRACTCSDADLGF